MNDRVEPLRRALRERYTIETELGRGGMATVYQARDLKHDRPVAIKVLHPDLAAALGPERFLREIRIAAGLNHPHILPLYDSGEADGVLFFVMPLVNGESLRNRLVREKQLPLEDSLRITREVADALSYAHAHGVVHRDIKPENVLLEGSHAIVADFGIARAISAAGDGPLTQTGVSVGTPAYMSPEQASGAGDVDGRTDLYSLACMLYEMLAGQPPFTGPTVESVVRQHLTADPPEVTRVRPSIPAEVAAALKRALAKSPADRFNSVALFAETLGRQGTARPRNIRAGSPGASRRVWLIAVASAAALAVLAAGAIALRPRSAAVDAPLRRVVAVLPLQNLTTDSSNAYFAGGLHDEILTRLSKIASLKVISRTSVQGYAGKNTPLKQISQELGAGTIVEGTVQVLANRLRVNVQLIDATTDAHVWAESYDRTLDDAFAIQTDVAEKIARAVGAAITTTERHALAAPPPDNPEAYRLYLEGREYLLKPGRIRDNYEMAQALFERAVALDPDFALTHVALSETHANMFFWRYDPTAARGHLVLREAETALRLAPDLPEAHVAMGLAHYRVRRAYSEALAEFAIAIKGLPNDATLRNGIASVQRRLGRWEDVLSEFRTIVQLDPRQADIIADMGGTTLLYLRRYDEAEAAFDHALRIAPDFHLAAINKGVVDVLRSGRLDKLRATLDRIPLNTSLGQMGSSTAQRVNLLLWERQPDEILRLLPAAPSAVFDAQRFYLPAALYAAWAHQLRDDKPVARAAFESARTVMDAAVARLPDDWRVHAARGLALAGLGAHAEALKEADWLRQSTVYREDALHGPLVAEDRARILAHVGDSSGAIDEIKRLLNRPSLVSVHTLRLDPRWDPLRQDSRFTALLAR